MVLVLDSVWVVCIVDVWLGEIVVVVDWIELNELVEVWDVVSVEWMLCSFEIVGELSVLVASFNEVKLDETVCWLFIVDMISFGTDVEGENEMWSSDDTTFVVAVSIESDVIDKMVDVNPSVVSSKDRDENIVSSVVDCAEVSLFVWAKLEELKFSDSVVCLDDDSVLTNDVVVSTVESFGAVYVDDAMSFDDEVGSVV
jgi:hypothetical protein